MELWDALGLAIDTADPGAVSRPVVAIVGGGGKTTLLYRLGREAEARGLRAVLAGTTSLTPAPPGRMPPLIGGGEPAMPAAVRAAIAAGPLTVVSPGRKSKGRLAAISVATADALAAIDGLGLLALEADGSRQRPFKAPADHEPVVPSSATHVIAVVGADAIDAPLDERLVHRPERVRALAGAAATICDIELIARVLASPEGGRKHADGLGFAVLVNKADLAPRPARELAFAVRAAGVPRVVLASLRDQANPVRELFS